GGQGTFLLAAARAFPHLRLMLFDLPAVAGLADKNFKAAGHIQQTSMAAKCISTQHLLRNQGL
ncbi:MAG: methyltransferase, partial [Betaproteobacteria bacterium]